MPERTVAGHEAAPAPEMPVTLDMPGKVADFLRVAELDDAERAALDQGRAVRRGQGYTLLVSAGPLVHRGLLARCQPFDGRETQSSPRTWIRWPPSCADRDGGGLHGTTLRLLARTQRARKTLGYS
ncbi:hypothetical protein AB0F13_27435 [Streptomyces sp. NPDC026206]|uniref:hypothetical protein n=1 Tax=Streptomyces sp. NPDC026206 TaxID=3157089 RepID=UPI0033F93503